MDMDNVTVAAILPTASAVLGNGTDSDNEYIAPLHQTHYHWDCLVDGPALSAPLPIRALIDHGSSTVLIDAAFADQLGLWRFRLHKPLKVGMGVMSGDVELCEFVKIRPFSADSWSFSKSLQAVVVNNLCAPILLDGPFLNANQIVIDHHLRTAISKLGNYDILNPMSPSPPPKLKPKLKPKQKALSIISEQQRHRCVTPPAGLRPFLQLFHILYLSLSLFLLVILLPLLFTSARVLLYFRVPLCFHMTRDLPIPASSLMILLDRDSFLCLVPLYPL